MAIVALFDVRAHTTEERDARPPRRTGSGSSTFGSSRSWTVRATVDGIRPSGPPQSECAAAEPASIPSMRLHLLARGVILRDGPELLVAQQVGADHVFLPGGHLERGERLVDALAREVREELGVDLRVGEYMGAVEHAYPDVDPTEYEVNHLFRAKLDDPAAELVSRESHLRFFWCPVGELHARRLLPSVLADRIATYAAGERAVIWASTLPGGRPTAGEHA
jgi:8-oxo-dGTP diphosphatase